MGGVERREMRAERQRRKRRRNWVERLQRDNPSAVTSRITIDQPLRSFSSVCHRHLPASPFSSPPSWLSSLPPSLLFRHVISLSLGQIHAFHKSSGGCLCCLLPFFFFLYVIATSASESSNIPGLRGTKRLCVCQRTTLNSSQGGWFVCSLACWKVLAGASLISVIMSVAR